MNIVYVPVASYRVPQCNFIISVLSTAACKAHNRVGTVSVTLTFTCLLFSPRLCIHPATITSGVKPLVPLESLSRKGLVTVRAGTSIVCFPLPWQFSGTSRKKSNTRR
jgi:hypothetical protein